MRKIGMCIVAIITSSISLAVLCLLDFLISIINYYLGKVPYLLEIMDSIGELLDFGLTAVIAIFVLKLIWTFGHSIIENINGKEIKFDKCPIFYTNCIVSLIFVAALIFFGIEFFPLIGSSVTSYTAEYEGFGKVLMFFEAIKDTYLYVYSQNVLLYKIGYNSLILGIVNLLHSGS